MKLQNRILVCPLDWGLGHASRMIPVIYSLIKHEFDVVIAADKYPLQLLKKEFPQLQFIVFPSVSIAYSKKNSQIFSMLKQAPLLLWQILKEHRKLNKIITDNDIDIVLSDNRYGLWNIAVQSIFVTHQINIMMPKGWSFFKALIDLFNLSFIKKYDQCWVPDLDGEINVSGDLSHKLSLPANAYFVGLLSRFTKLKTDESFDQTTDVLVILSGPEPQRSIFEEQIKKELCNSTYSAIIVGGTPGDEIRNFVADKIIKVPHLDTEGMRRAILSSKNIICRSGYSSIMDFIALKKTAFLVPTPGQTEQEYLAAYMTKREWFCSCSQADFNLNKAIEKIQMLHPVFPDFNEDLLHKAVSAITHENTN